MYKTAIFISGVSSFLGILREILIIYFLGFTYENDQLQIYLSIFYIASLSFDAFRLSTLNLFNSLSINRIILMSLLLIIPFVTLITLSVAISIRNVDYLVLSLCYVGTILNYITLLLINFKQRSGIFFMPQLINILPNFILLPGILIAYYFFKSKFNELYIFYCFLLPLIQLVMLSFIKTPTQIITKKIALIDAMKIFIRHGFSTSPAQLFQIIVRSLFYHYSPGYLSILSFFSRLFSAIKFILVDSYIASKIATDNIGHSMTSLLNYNRLNLLLVFCSLPFLFFSLLNESKFIFEMALCIIFSIGFYFDTLLRITYFKINRIEHDKHLIQMYGFFEMSFSIVGCLVVIYLLDNPIWYIWIWFILRTYSEIFLIKRKQLTESVTHYELID